MANQRPTPKVTGLVAASFTVLLVGCSGTTYGTGVTQEQQLLDDVTSLATIGSGTKKKRINYNSRPKLVKVTDASTLPSPSESVGGESAYFPEDPEEKRARLLASTANDDPSELSPEVIALREESLARQRRDGKLPHQQENEGGVGNFYKDDERIKQLRAQKAAKLQAQGGKKRRYLTEPPDEYRRAAETAPVGVTGENEKPPGLKGPNKKNLFDQIFGS